MADQAWDEATMKCGLLMESAQAHQRMAEGQLQRLATHTQGLDAVVRDEIRRTLIEELEFLRTGESRGARAPRQGSASGFARRAAPALAAAALCALLPIAAARWVLPTPASVAQLRAQRDALKESIQKLEARGARMELASCGESARLCVRVDPRGRPYGAKGDYFVIQGY